jgi:hypothetical protein
VSTRIPFSPDDFYRAYAIAMLNWQKVESALFRFYFWLFDNGNLQQAGAAYYSLDSFGAKLRLADATAAAVLGEAKLAFWKDLSNQIRTASKDRNALAHLPAVVETNMDGSLSLMLGRHVYVPPSLLRKRTTKYDAETCERLAFHFEELEKKVDAFVSQTRS